jgi:hypothetical protein
VKGTNVSEEHITSIFRWKRLLPSSDGFLLALFFNPEDGGNMFLRNVSFFPNYTVLQLRKL